MQWGCFCGMVIGHIMALFSKLFGDPNEKQIERLEKIVATVNEREDTVSKLSDEDLKKQTTALKEQLASGKTLDDILPQAFALVREVSKRTLGMRHFDVQIMGGIVLHEGKIAEMKTGEGKTLAATLPLYLNALSGKGAHLVTVNDYLARRDTAWMGQIYDALGASVGCIAHDQAFIYDATYKADADDDKERDATGSFRVAEDYLRPCTRGEAYAADITYGTNNEYGFDYLRDNMAYMVANLSARTEAEGGFNYTIVDEVDSILIDEARTPLILSAPDQDSGSLYKTFSTIAPGLKEESDYTVDEKMRAVSITEEGITKVEKTLGVENIYDPAAGGGMRYVHHLEQALRANVLYQKDKDYVVKDGEVILVDEFTGRLMPGRRLSEGLHQAIEAKEHVEVQKESRTLASITFQNYFRMYKKLAGMTGTALSNAEEFDRVYGLYVVAVPTNKPLIRADKNDFIFRTRTGKFQAAVQEIAERHKKGQPVLVGTTSIEQNELLSKMLEVEGVSHQILNAKNHMKEGEIIAQAGKFGRVTVATNMAGRGVDIVLGGNPQDPKDAKKVLEVGGLFVLGTERHEARRIDDQLRGRAGRQGDPGETQFFLSLEDDVMRVFGGGRVQNLMKTLRIPEDQPIESGMVSGAIESAQKKIEGYNFDVRKHVLDYDEVLNKHRQALYKKRREVLLADSKTLDTARKEAFSDFAKNVTLVHTAEARSAWNTDEIFDALRAITGADEGVQSKLADYKNEVAEDEVVRENITAYVIEVLLEQYKGKREKAGEDKIYDVERWVHLRTMDMFWMDHLEAMDHMRDSVRLRAYGQRDPLAEYKSESRGMYYNLFAGINENIVQTLFRAELKEAPHVHAEGHQHESSHTTGTPSAADTQKHSTKVGRNDPCPCGAKNPQTGKTYKYKKCGMINAPHHKG